MRMTFNTLGLSYARKSVVFHRIKTDFHHSGNTQDKKRFKRRLVAVLLLAQLACSVLHPALAATAEDFRTREYMRNGAALDSIHAADAYALGYSGAGVTVGIINRVGDLSGNNEFNGKVDAGSHWISDPSSASRTVIGWPG